MKRGLERVVDVLGELLAMLTILLIIVLYINGKLNFVDAELLPTLSRLRELAIITVLGLKSLEFALKRNWIFCVIFLAVIAVAYAMMFYGGAPIWNF